jgi:glutamate--cysteine ligase
MARNQHAVAERGREPGLVLQKGASAVGLAHWGLAVVEAMLPIAHKFDTSNGTTAHTEAVQAAIQGLNQPDTLPSARVLQSVREDHAGSFVGFVQARSLHTKDAMLQTALQPSVRERLELQSRESIQAQRAIEAADTMPFDVYLQEYLSPRRLLA